jgi:hypothetical protein
MSVGWAPLRIDTPARYVLRVDGIVRQELVPWLGGLEIRPGTTGQTTQLSGAFLDQSALLGALKTLVHAGHALVSIECLGPLAESV